MTNIDGVSLVVRQYQSMPVGRVYSGWQTEHPAAVGDCRSTSVRRDAEDAWTLGLGNVYRSPEVAVELEHVAGTVEDMARAYARLFPDATASYVSSEEGRRRFAAECSVRNIAEAERYRVHTNKLTADLARAMEKAGCTCRFLAEQYMTQGDWRDYHGYAVYSDTQEGADRIAAWILRWSGKPDWYIHKMDPRHGAPFAAFAALESYSCGD